MLSFRQMEGFPMKKSHTQFPSHNDQTVSLKRIEGQIRGIAKMIQEGQYCVDVINQIQAATNALQRVSEKIFEKHLQHCVASVLTGKSQQERQTKIQEVLGIIHRMHG